MTGVKQENGSHPFLNTTFFLEDVVIILLLFLNEVERLK